MAKNNKADAFWAKHWRMLLEISMEQPVLLDLLLWGMNSNLSHDKFLALAKIIDKRIRCGRW